MQVGNLTPKTVLALLMSVLVLVAVPAWADDDHDEPGDAMHQDAEPGDGGDGHDGDGEGHRGGHGSRLSDEKIPLQIEGFPQRPKPLIELGEPFLGTGTLDPGIQLPTGAVWQPALTMFGTLRTAVQTTDSGGDRITEWANRLDLFFNLALSGSERVVLGLRPFDEGGRFSSYFFEHPDPALDGAFRDELDLEIESLYFEGDFGEIFPNLDKTDFGSLDIGFSVGRQPLFFQEGMLINDALDGIGLTRNTLLLRNTSNFRATFLAAWDNVDAGGVERDANLYALLTSTDFRLSTVDFDVAWVDADDGTGDLLSAGLSAVQRLGKLNTAFRVLGSVATGDETALSTDGLLWFSEVSWEPRYTQDLVYFTTFWAVDEFSSAARGPATGGPLGRAGINFAAPGLGSVGAPLSSRARDVAGGAFGYQKFFDATRKQIIVEAGFRIGTDAAVDDAYALTARYQAALRQHFVVVVDGFVGNEELAGGGSDTLYGSRVELVIKF
jgi:hypothetical protein